jgi:hypothetical protein
MGACNGWHTLTFKHLELEAEGLDLSDLDLGEYEGPAEPSSTTVVYTVSLVLAKGSENDALQSVLRSFPRKHKKDHAQLYYRPGVVTTGSLRERAQKRLRADLAQVLNGHVPPNTNRESAAPV